MDYSKAVFIYCPVCDKERLDTIGVIMLPAATDGFVCGYCKTSGLNWSKADLVKAMNAPDGDVPVIRLHETV